MTLAKAYDFPSQRSATYTIPSSVVVRILAASALMTAVSYGSLPHGWQAGDSANQTIVRAVLPLLMTVLFAGIAAATISLRRRTEVRFGWAAQGILALVCAVQVVSGSHIVNTMNKTVVAMALQSPSSPRHFNQDPTAGSAGCASMPSTSAK